MENITAKNPNRTTYLLTIILVGSVVYFNCLNTGFFALDDIGMLSDVKSSGLSIRQLFFPQVIDRYFRPFTTTTFILNYKYFLCNAAAFHLVNLIIHLLNSLLVYFLSLEIAGEADKKEESALISALIFALHPLNSEAVLWISARPDLLSCFFCLVFLIILARERSEMRVSNFFLVFVSYLGAFLSKESAAMLFPLTVLYLITDTKKLPKKSSIMLILTVIIASVSYCFMRNGFNVQADSGLGKVISADRSPQKIIMGDLAACGFYLRKMLFPFPLSVAITHISNIVNTAFSLTVFPLLFLLYCKAKRFRLPILILLTGLAPPLLALTGNLPWTPYAERYMYLPMVGFSLIIGGVVMELVGKIPFVVVLSAILLISIPTVNRVGQWTDPIAFWQDETSKAPAFAGVRLAFGAELIKSGMYDAAEKQLDAAKKIGFRRGTETKAYVELVATLRKKRNPAAPGQDD